MSARGGDQTTDKVGLRGAWRMPLTDVAMPERDVQAVLDCLRSGWLTMGPRTQALEAALARYVGESAAGGGLQRHGGVASRRVWRPALGRVTR